jgi:hypothetical protein
MKNQGSSQWTLIFVILCGSTFGCAFLSQPPLSHNYVREPDVSIAFFWNSNWEQLSDTDEGEVKPVEPLEALFDGDVASSVTFRFPKKFRHYQYDIDTVNSIHEIGGGSNVGFIIRLPSERKLKKMVVHAEYLDDFDVQTRPEDDIAWQTQARIRNNRQASVTLNLSVTAKSVRIIAVSDYRLSDDGAICIDGRPIKSYASAPAKICEVELYGWAK